MKEEAKLCFPENWKWIFTLVIHKQSSQQSKVTQGEANEDVKKDVYDHESNHQARVAQSLQAHDYVSFLLESILELIIRYFIIAVSENC